MEHVSIFPHFSYLSVMKEVAVGILRVDGRVLACQRKRNAVYPLKWEFPGGKVEAGESPPQALRRELGEELGIDATPGVEIHRQEWVYAEGVANPERDGSFRVFYYFVDRYTGEPANHAFEEIRWVTVAELDRLDMLEGNREAVDILLKR
jgi:8-oxo-dGTP diphosphatase